MQTFRAIGTATDGWFWVSFLAAYWTLLIFVLSYFRIEKVMLAASFCTWVMSAVLWAGDLISWQIVAIATLLLMASYYLAGEA